MVIALANRQGIAIIDELYLEKKNRININSIIFIFRSHIYKIITYHNMKFLKPARCIRGEPFSALPAGLVTTHSRSQQIPLQSPFYNVYNRLVEPALQFCYRKIDIALIFLIFGVHSPLPSIPEKRKINSSCIEP